MRLYGRDGFVYSDPAFPYIIHYTVEEWVIDDFPEVDGWIHVVFLVER